MLKKLENGGKEDWNFNIKYKNKKNNKNGKKMKKPYSEVDNERNNDRQGSDKNTHRQL